jgi:hypothetical protein
MRWAHDAAVRGSDGKNRKLQIVGMTPFKMNDQRTPEHFVENWLGKAQEKFPDSRTLRGI